MQARPGGGGTLAGSREQPLRVENRRLGADRPVAPRSGGGVARPRRVGAADLRCRDARARHPRRARDRRRAIRRRLARPAGARHLPARRRAPRSKARARRPRFQVEGLRASSPQRRSGVAQDRRAGNLCLLRRLRQSRQPAAQGLLRHLVGSARTGPWRGLELRAAAGRSHREGRRHVRRRGPAGRLREMARRARDGHRPGCAPERPDPDRHRVGGRRGAAWHRRRSRGSGPRIGRHPDPSAPRG